MNTKPIHGGYPTPQRRGTSTLYKNNITICNTCREVVTNTYENGWADKCTNIKCGIVFGIQNRDSNC